VSSTKRPRRSETGRSECGQKNQRQKALEILARMIVRAYLGEIDRGEAGPTAYQKGEMKVKDTNKKCCVGPKASQRGENKVGKQKGEC